MSGASIFMLVLICVVIYGGLGVLLGITMKHL